MTGGPGTMKGPTPEAVNRALSILLDSVMAENQDHGQLRVEGNQPLRSQLANLMVAYDGLEVAQRALIKESRARRARVGQERNSLIPLGNLPAELSVDILVRSLTEQDMKETMRLQELSSVQASWWMLIKNRPDFWIHFHPRKQHPIPEQLRKSGVMPIHIDCGEYLQHGFLRQLEPHSHRWRSFNFGGLTAVVLRDYFNTMAEWPLLEELRLKARSLNGLPISIPKSPRLNKLYIDSVRLSVAELSDLRVIDISNIPDFDLQRLIHLLRSSQDLVELHLTHLQVGPPLQPLAAHDQLVLPKLAEITMTDLSPTLSDSLFSFLDVPNLAYANIANASEDTGTVLAQVARKFLPPLLESGALPSISINLSDSEVVIKGSGSLDFSFFGINYNDVWGSELEDAPIFTISGARPIHLTIESQLESEELEGVAALPGKFTNVETLTLHATPRFVTDVARSLGQVDNGEWPCPKLEKLYIGNNFESVDEWVGEKWDAVNDALVEMLQARNGAPIEPMTGRLPPQRLKVYRARRGETEFTIYDPTHSG